MPPWEKYAAPASNGPWAKYGKAEAPKKSGVLDQIGAFAQSATEQIPFLDEAAAGTIALLKGVPYEEVRKVQKGLATEDREKRPLARNLGGIAGFGATLAAPGAKYVGKATSLGQAALRSSQVGAAYGALSGAASSDDGIKNRASGALKGGVAGAAIGGSAPYIARGAQAATNRIRGAASEVADRVRLGLGKDLPELSEKQIAQAGENALGYVGGLAKRVPNSLASNPVEAAGKPILAAEAIGRPGVTELAAIGRRSGSTGDALESTLRQRQAGTPDRVLGDLERVTGLSPEIVNGDFVAHTKALRPKATPLYDKFYAEPPVQRDRLDALFSRPSMRTAMGRAASIAQEEGRDPNALGFAFNAAGDVTHVKTPSNQTLDYIKRGLDDVLEGYRDSTTGKLRLDERGRAVLGTLNEYRGLVAPKGSTYRAALDAGGEPIRLEQAYNGAKKLMGNNTPLRIFETRFDALSPAEQEAHVAGFVNSAYEGAQSGRLRLKDMQSPVFQKKLTKMLGPERTQEFLSQIENEVALARTGGRMTPGTGSPTMELQAADREREEAVGGLVGAAKETFRGRPVSGALSLIASPVIGAYRGARVPLDRATRDEVGRLLQLSPSELDRVLKAAETANGPLKFRAPNTAPTTNALARAAGSGLADNGR